jgi:hypothetical protein
MNRLIVVVVACAGALLSACTASSSGVPGVVRLSSSSADRPSSSSSSASSGALAFSQCMRSQGLSQFPDPDSSGAIPKVSPQQLGVSTTAFDNAQQACANLLQLTHAQTQQVVSGMRDFARCMRSHGVRNWPDPITDSDGTPVFDLHGRINPDSTQSATVSGQCAHLLRPAPGQDGTVLCDGIGEAGCHHYG